MWGRSWFGSCRRSKISGGICGAITKEERNPYARSSHDDRHRTLRLARRLDGDLHVLPKRGEKFDEAADGKITGAVAHQRGYMRLLDAENLSSLRLGEAALTDDLVDLQCQASLEKLLLRVRQAEIGKDVAAARFCSDSCFVAHVSSAFPCNAAP